MTGDKDYYFIDEPHMYMQDSSGVLVPEEHHDLVLTAQGAKSTTFQAPDLVNQPPHYNQGDIELVDYLRDNLSPEGFRGYLEGNVKKYAHRFRHKGGVQDLEKSQWYLDRLIKELKNG